MTHIGTLWGDPRQRQTKVILSVAALNGLELSQPQFSFTDRPKEFEAKFPYGKIPAFEGAGGLKVARLPAVVICSTGTKINLLGSNAEETAIVDQWVHFTEHKITTPTYGISTMIRGLVPFNREIFNKYTEQLVCALKYLESHLAIHRNGYVALDRLTFADLVVASTTYAAAHITLGSAERAQYPHVFVHYNKVTEYEDVKQYWGTEGFLGVRRTEPNETAW